MKLFWYLHWFSCRGFTKTQSQNGQNGLFNNLKNGVWFSDSKVHEKFWILSHFIKLHIWRYVQEVRLKIWNFGPFQGYRSKQMFIFTYDIYPIPFLRVSWCFMHFCWYLKVKTPNLCLITWTLSQISNLGR